MSERADPRLSFHPEVPGLQTAWDSTSIGLLKECPRKYQYAIIEGWRPRVESVHLSFGLYYHGALEEYDRQRATGADHEDALRAAVRWALSATYIRLPDGGGRPWLSDDSAKNRETLIRSVIWYLDHFRDDPAHTIILANGKPAVELSFRFELGFRLQGEEALASGHLDRFVEFQGDTWFLDRKTTKSTLSSHYFAQFSPDNQMSMYTLASQVVYRVEARGGIIDACQVGATFSRFQRGFTYRHRTEMEEWTQELRHYIRMAELFAINGFWPKNDKACNNYGGCPYRPICSEAPIMREKWLRASHHKVLWDPLQVRGDI